MVAKRKIAFHPEKGYPIEPASNPPKTVRRNARERNRVKQIDVGFDKLKNIIPHAANQKKISRVKILAFAHDYIHHLSNILGDPELAVRTATAVTNHQQQQQVKQEPLNHHQTVLSNRADTPPKPVMGPTAGVVGGNMVPMTPYQAGYMHYPPLQASSPMNVHSPISPYSGYDTASMSSGYYSQHSPGTRSNHSYRDFYSPRVISPGYKDSHSPSGYSETSLNIPYGTPPIPQVTPQPAPPPLTQDPTTSSTFVEEDEDILNSIIQWEKY